MKKRLKIYCEGQTEEMIVNRLLKGHLQIRSIHVERPVLAATTLDPAGQRGGFVNWAAIQFAGLETARAKCPRFNAWLAHLENWGGQA